MGFVSVSKVQVLMVGGRTDDRKLSPNVAQLLATLIVLVFLFNVNVLQAICERVGLCEDQ